MHRRIDVAEREFVRGNLAARMRVPLPQQQNELFLGKVGIEVCERNHVERKIPGCVPREFPVVRYRDDIAVIQVQPVAIAACPSFGGRRWERPGRPPATPARRTGRTASTIIVRPPLAARWRARAPPARSFRKIRLFRACVARTRRRNREIRSRLRRSDESGAQFLPRLRFGSGNMRRLWCRSPSDSLPWRSP